MAQFSSFCFAVSGEGSFIEKKRRGIRGSLFPKFLFRWSSCCAVTGQGSSQVRDFLPLPSRSPRDPFPFALPPPSSTLRNSFPPLVIPAGVPFRHVRHFISTLCFLSLLPLLRTDARINKRAEKDSCVPADRNCISWWKERKGASSFSGD